jgi:hypothetical protein
MKLLKKFTFIFFLVLCLSFVVSFPPVTTVFTGDVGLNIETQFMSVYKYGEPRFSTIFISNSSTGFSMNITTNPSIECYVYLRDSQGFEIMSLQADPHLDHWDLNGSDGGLTPIGSYAWTVRCDDYDAEVGGTVGGYFDITLDGEDSPVEDAVVTNSNNILILLAILFFIIIIGLIIGFIFTYGKYVSYIFISLFYILSNVFFLILWKMSITVSTTIPFFEVLFEVLWKISNIGYFVFFPVLLFFMVMKKFDETGDNKMKSMGYDDDTIKMVKNRGKRR